jgi:hypothetical protein
MCKRNCNQLAWRTERAEVRRSLKFSVTSRKINSLRSIKTEWQDYAESPTTEDSVTRTNTIKTGRNSTFAKFILTIRTFGPLRMLKPRRCLSFWWFVFAQFSNLNIVKHWLSTKYTQSCVRIFIIFISEPSQDGDGMLPSWIQLSLCRWTAQNGRSSDRHDAFLDEKGQFLSGYGIVWQGFKRFWRSYSTTGDKRGFSKWGNVTKIFTFVKREIFRLPLPLRSEDRDKSPKYPFKPVRSNRIGALGSLESMTKWPTISAEKPSDEPTITGYRLTPGHHLVFDGTWRSRKTNLVRRWYVLKYRNHFGKFDFLHESWISKNLWSSG